MSLGIDGVRSRMAELQARLDSISGTPTTPPSPPPPPGGLSFSDALNAAQNPLSGAIGPNGSFDGATIRPMGIDGLNLQPTQSEGELRSLANSIAGKHSLNPKVLEALVEQESGFNPLAESKVGAQGLTQLMPATARGLGVTDPFDPVQNLNGGAKYLKQMLNQFDGNLPEALAAYNAGPGAVRKFHGIPPYAETQNYVKRIMSKLGQ